MQIEIKERKIFFDGKEKITFDEILHSISVVENDIVYLSGSLIEGYMNEFSKGMGNLYSDIDVFVIRDSEKFKMTDSVYETDVNKTFFCDKNGLDIEVFDKSYVQSLSDVLSKLRVEKGVRVFNILKEKLDRGNDNIFINSFLNRFLYSICIYNEKSYQELQSQINYSNYLKLKQCSLINIIDNLYDDVKGNLFVREADAALQIFRMMIMSLLEVVLAKEEIFVDRDKWVALKFINVTKSKMKYNNIYNMYMDIFRGDLIDNDKCLEKIEYYLPHLEEELEKILLEGLEI
ncbi:MAG: hypothetical protein FWE14_01595 [Lachnospiraceae bacterium]|nr:hypothetical protein [Lachnospiraceae bacterium]